ncbi:MAG: lipoprotein insertase outer membrane protein LolB [Nitrosomonas sp.]|nr:lipoprotein insertase outer membrane protein LolB [Nitrosomonas sp.]MDP1950843.1 lipoprotein insertase outer membrane protein LolB [Nitrosomonas sp.]
MLWQQSISKRVHLFPVWKLVLCIFPLIASCAALSTKSGVVHTIITEPVASSEHIASTSFSLTGRISIQDERQRSSGGIRWQHTENSDEIFLLSPFGQIMAQIERDHDSVRLTTSEQKVYYAADMSELTEEVLGWKIPLTGLQYWAQGTHSPTTLSMKDLDRDGKVVAIRQDGWEINYINYFPAQSVQHQRPRVLALSYETLKIKLVVDNWDTE